MSLVERSRLRWMFPRVYLRRSRSPYPFPSLTLIFLTAFFVGSKLVAHGWVVLPACGLRAMTSLPCPGCGGTRAVIAFFQGELLQALAYNPLVVFFCLLWTGVALNLLLFKTLGYRVHWKWLNLSYRARFLLAAAALLVDWVAVVQLSRGWGE